MTSQSTRTIAVTGGSGFVGRCVLSHLTSQGYRVRALFRNPQRCADIAVGLEPVEGDLFDHQALDALLHEADAVIHLVGIIRERRRQGQTFERIHHEAVAQLAEAAERHGVKRFIHMSALGTRLNAPSPYHRTKYLGEQEVRSRQLDWTILRPSLIHGPGGEFTNMLRDFWQKRFPPFVPYFGKGFFGFGGSGLVQPIYVEDVARCFVDALDRPQTIGKVCELGGANGMDWPTMYHTFAEHLAKRRHKPVTPIPVWLALCLSLIPGTPFSRAQVLMAKEDSVCELDPIQDMFGFMPMGFDTALSKYADA